MRRPPPRHSSRSSQAKPLFSRHSPPPDRTGLEAVYFASQKEAGHRVVVLLRTGDTLRGTVEEADHETIAIRPEGGPPVVVRKADIRYLHEADD